MPIPNQFRPHGDDGRRCIHCRFVDVRINRVTGNRGLRCLCPKCFYGQASEERPCCSWVREPGADDEAGLPAG